MQHPKGIAIVLGVLFGLMVVGAVVGGIVLFRSVSKTPVTNTPGEAGSGSAGNTNTALQLACSNDADCISYCGGDPNYQPICGVTTIGGVGSCTCRSTTGAIVPTGNTNAAANTNTPSNVNVNRNVNASTNANTNNTVSTTSWKLYSNTELGFTLKFPSTWEGYSVSDVTSNHSITFTHPKKVSSKGNPGEVSFIIIKLGKDAAVPQGDTVIKRDANSTFVYAQSNAAAPDEMNAFWEQIPTIIGTFTFWDYSLNLPASN